MRASALLIAMTTAVTPVWAHDTWLLPARFRVEPGTAVIAEATSAMHFPRSETPVRPERLVRSGVRLGKETGALAPGSSTPTALSLRAVAASPGVAALWFESRPRTLDLKDDQVEEYLKEIGAWETVGAEWRRAGRKPWRETYVKCAKTFVGVGHAQGDRSWATPVGLALELVPDSDPTTIRAGESLRLKLLRNGTAVAGQPVAAQRAGGEPVLRQTDAEGGVLFALDHAGPWLVKATDIRRGARDGEWESWFTTLTVAATEER
jgi:hypothetical protein